jgi:hypothetical protein
MMQSILSALHPYLGPFFIISLNFVLWGRVGGFPSLVAHYAHRSPFAGQKWHWQSAAIGWVSYRSCLTVGANPTGLYLAPWAIFRAGQPPILIPWSELQVGGPKWWWLMRMYPMRAKARPGVVIRIPDRLFHKLALASDGRLSVD